MGTGGSDLAMNLSNEAKRIQSYNHPGEFERSAILST